MDIGIKLKAKNSSGEQTLSFSKEDGEYWATLHGQYKGSYLQIDFDEFEKSDLEDMKAAIELLLE